MSLEVYKRKRRAKTSGPALTICRNGSLDINKATVALLRRHAPDEDEERVFVALCFDRENQGVGLMPVTRDHKNAYPVRQYKSSRNVISGSGFLKFFEIDYETQARQIKGEWDPENALLLFRLTDDEEPAREVGDRVGDSVSN